ncbi:cNMP [Musa troglodytarum]|uniref:CNMP n=1 Tax=Musa troglodytarum TaxID=320322 RepID=A0A9E7I3R8_9LILI|nr:cNMP [Musa troglodytarum]
MAEHEKDYVPMLSGNIEMRRFTARSASMSMPPNASYDGEDSLVFHTGPLRTQRASEYGVAGGPLSRNRKPENHWTGHGKLHNRSHAVMPEVLGGGAFPDTNYVTRNEHLLMSGPLGLCNNPDCTECPAVYKAKRSHQKSSVSLEKKNNKCIVFNWSLATAIAVVRSLTDFIYLLHIILQFRLAYVAPESRVVGAGDLVDQPKKIVLHYLRGYFCLDLFVMLPLPQVWIISNISLLFLVNSLSSASVCLVRFVGLKRKARALGEALDCAGLNFVSGCLNGTSREEGLSGFSEFGQGWKSILPLLCWFRVDCFHKLGYKYGSLWKVFKQSVMILAVIPEYVGSSEANYAKNLLRVTVLLQYIPRIIRFLPLLGGQSASGFIFESAWANFIINLLMFALAGHVVGSCWYLFGLQRVNQCLQDICSARQINFNCSTLIDCGRGHVIGNQTRQQWVGDNDSSACFNTDGDFDYGIYQKAVLLTTESSVVKRYIYSLFWGFQQISTLAGNLGPSYFVWEVLFTMAIVGLGLLLFALLIGNMQNFLQALGRRRLEMQLRRRDVERWMSHRRLPEPLRRKVRQAERFSWAATRGVNEEELLENLPEDIQREIRRHFFKFLNKVRIFTLMDEPILDAVCEKLRQKVYIGGSAILYEGGPVEKMVFIVRGKLESIGADGNVAPLSEGDVCGEELLTWYLEHSSINKEGGKIRFPGSRLFATRTVKCVTNVEAFALRAADLEEVTTLFSRFLRNPHVQGAIRYESPYWRNMAATRIQVTWRYRQRRIKRVSTNSSSHAR